MLKKPASSRVSSTKIVISSIDLSVAVVSIVVVVSWP